MRALLWCNGEKPSDRVLTGLVEETILFGVDGGADKAAESGFEVTEVLGDLDSISKGWEGEITELADQSSSDLAKSLILLAQRGFEEIDVVGCEGGSSSHHLGSGGSDASEQRRLSRESVRGGGARGGRSAMVLSAAWLALPRAYQRGATPPRKTVLSWQLWFDCCSQN